MTKEEAEKYAKNMTYCEAIYNLKQAKSVPYRKATFTKINELLDELEQEPCEDAVSRAEVIKIAKEMYLEVANMELDVKTISDCISYTASKCREVLEKRLQALSSVTPQEPILEKDGTFIVTTEHCEKVGRVLVQYGTNGTLFYQDQEQRKGHWVAKPHVFGVRYCSECDFELRIDNTNFCPNCGAKMAESEGKE